jgi:hypothetical protein
LPTDSAIQGLSPFQAFYLYAHIKKEQSEKRKFIHETVKLLCYMINPSGAKRVFEGKGGPGENIESVEISEADFIAQIKKMDPNFDEAAYKRLTGNGV